MSSDIINHIIIIIIIITISYYHSAVGLRAHAGRARAPEPPAGEAPPDARGPEVNVECEL